MASFVPVVGSGTRSCDIASALAAEEVPPRVCIARRTFCRPRNICFSSRYLFSIMWSYPVDMSRGEHLETGPHYLRPSDELSYSHHPFQFRWIWIAENVYPVLVCGI